jgi:hypothetical protein
MFTFGCSDGVDIQILFSLFGKDIVVVLLSSASLKSTDSNPFSKLLVSFPVNVVAIVFVVCCSLIFSRGDDNFSD